MSQVDQKNDVLDWVQMHHGQGFFLGGRVWRNVTWENAAVGNAACSQITLSNLVAFLARDVIYTSRAYATMSVSVSLSICPSVCDVCALWS